MAGEGERSLAGSGEGGLALAGSGDGGRALLRSLDYPCTARLRLRRLLAYHRRYSYEEIYEVARDKTRVIFDVRNLVNKIKSGQWRKASIYVLSFVRPDSMSHECKLLLMFIQDLMVLNDFADGNTSVARLVSKWFVSIYGNPALAAYPCFAALVEDVLFLRSDHARAFLKWQPVKNKAAEMVQEMAYNMPELKDKLHFPRGPNNLYHVVPIGSSFHRRCTVKNLARQQPIDLAQFYLHLKKRMPSSIQGESAVFKAGSATIQQEPLIALLEKALQAGRHSLLEQVHPHEYPSKEGFPLMQMLSRSPFMAKYSRGQASQEHPSKQGNMHTVQIKLQYTSFLFFPCFFPSLQILHRVLLSSPVQKLAAPLNILPKEMLARSPFLVKTLRGQAVQESSAVVVFAETNSAMKRMSFQESHRDAAHPGNDSKRLRTTGNFGEDPFSSAAIATFQSQLKGVHKSGGSSRFPEKVWSAGAAIMHRPLGGGL
ncbi:unnamed protein product [Urochloa decumbens]|uniref:Uncharacterized protein n=1 Tax=Urochloa decumbens TaxID=240449 RepID=A0ABC9CSV4_9POAL